MMNEERRKELEEAVGWLADALDRVNRLADEECEDDLESVISLRLSACDIQCVIERVHGVIEKLEKIA